MATGLRLTERNLEVLSFMRRRAVETGCTPSIREIGRELGILSPNGVVCHIRKLDEAGLVRRLGIQSKSVQLVPEPGCCAACGRKLEG